MQDIRLPVASQGRWLGSVVREHLNYSAVATNADTLNAFRLQVIRVWLKPLRRRSQEGINLTWERFKRWVDK